MMVFIISKNFALQFIMQNSRLLLINSHSLQLPFTVISFFASVSFSIVKIFYLSQFAVCFPVLINLSGRSDNFREFLNLTPCRVLY